MSCRVKSKSYNCLEQLEASLGNWMEKQRVRMNMGMRVLKAEEEGENMEDRDWPGS